MFGYHSFPTESTVSLYISVSQPPGRGPVPGPGIHYTGPREILLELITNLNVILCLSTCHTVHIIVLILFMIMSQLIINAYVSLMYELKRNWKGTDEQICWDRALVLWKKNLPGRGPTRLRNTDLHYLRRESIIV